MSVLAHIVLNGSLPNEPAATQALAHILNSSADIARSFVGFLRKVDIEFELGHIRAELGHEESFPDLTIYDRHGCVRVFVENKFWAGLTDAQPVSYLEHLPDDPPSALLFVVPQQRVASIWSELKRRCAQAGLEWENASVNSIIKCSRVGCKTLLITSWTHVLEGLLDTARAGEHDTIRHDILQLQGLTNRMDSEAFLPIRSDELTSEEIARRLINYSDLIEDIVQQLKDSGCAATDGLMPSHGYYTAGRYLRLHERFGIWFGVELKVWRDVGITPLWIKFHNTEFSGVLGHHRTIRERFDDALINEESGFVCVPIRLTTSEERDRVVEDAVAQISWIADKLLEMFPHES